MRGTLALRGPIGLRPATGRHRTVTIRFGRTRLPPYLFLVMRTYEVRTYGRQTERFVNPLFRHDRIDCPRVVARPRVRFSSPSDPASSVLRAGVSCHTMWRLGRTLSQTAGRETPTFVDHRLVPKRLRRTRFGWLACLTRMMLPLERDR